MSWKMSLVGQVDWYFQVTVCARDTCGIATAAAPVGAAPARNLRRVADLDVRDCSLAMGIALLRLPRVFLAAFSGPLGDNYKPPGQRSYSGCVVGCTGCFRSTQGT